MPGQCHVYDILEELANNNSRNEKIRILTRNKDNDDLKQVIFFALNPYFQFYIRKIPKYDASGTNTVEWFTRQLGPLQDRTVTGNAAIEYLTGLLSSLTPDSAIVAERIIKKDLRCGVQESTVNKVWKGHIPTYPCLLGKGYDEKTISKISWPAYAQLKADGMRVNAIIEWNDGKDPLVSLRGRSGKLVDLLGHMDSAFIRLALDIQSSVVIDGELVVEDSQGNVLSRKAGNGILNKAIRGTISDEEASRVRMRIWDIIDYIPYFDDRYDDTPYKERLARISSIVQRLPSEKYEMVETRTVSDFSEAEKFFAEATSLGEEGIMVKNQDSPWEDKRSHNLIKFKCEEECDLRITGWVEGTGKYAGMLGALVGETSDGMIVVSVGSGFSDADRASIGRDVIGKIMTVRYNERIDKKGDGPDSLFLPRYLEIREDKDDADHSSKVK